MTWEKGKSGNPTGREVGTKNKRSEDFRRALAKAMAGHVKDIPKMIKGLDKDTDKLLYIEKFMPYFAPKLKSVDITVDNGMGDLFRQLAGLDYDRLFELKWGRKPDSTGADKQPD